jgi:hypothetical protein
MQEREMSQDRVTDLLAAYFSQPYVDYGDVVIEIKNSGGLTSEEVQKIRSRVLAIDANAMIRHTGSAEDH